MAKIDAKAHTELLPTSSGPARRSAAPACEGSASGSGVEGPNRQLIFVAKTGTPRGNHVCRRDQDLPLHLEDEVEARNESACRVTQEVPAHDFSKYTEDHTRRVRNGPATAVDTAMSAAAALALVAMSVCGAYLLAKALSA